MPGTAEQIETLYRQSLERHRAGALDDARAGYIQVLDADPAHARAMHRLGNIDLRAGRLEDAERLMRRAAELEPDLAGLHNSLGNVLRALGQPQQALAAYREELRQRPDFAVTHHQVGLLLLDLGRLEDALKAVQKAIFHAPRFAVGYNTLGRIFNNLDRLDEAQQALQRALHFDPALTEAQTNLAHVLLRMGKTERAREQFEQALASDPDIPRAHRQLGIIALEAGDSDKAIEHLDRAVALDEKDGIAQYSLGLVYQRRAVYERARALFQRAVELLPDYVDAHCNLAAVERSLGNLEAAERSFRNALAIAPRHVHALSGLAGALEMQGRHDEAAQVLAPHIQSGAAMPELDVIYATILQRKGETRLAIETLEHALAARPHEFHEMVLHFKLGDLYDRDGDHEKALGHFERGNALCNPAFDAGELRQRTSRIVEAFGKKRLAALASTGNDSEVPLFIVGLPRSGTTLVEQIIDTHPEAHGAGEQALMRSAALKLPELIGTTTPYPECIAEITEATVRELARQYLAHLQRFSPSATRITDKMWQNYEHLGLIHALFPRARIVHCRRDPRDALLSCYFQLFGTGNIPFSYDRDHLLAAYECYRTLMRHWQGTIPMLEVVYEELVADPEAQIRRIVDYTGLSWDPACLAFYENRRGVATASYDQVRQPIYTESAGRHRHYMAGLADWFERIGKVA